MADRLVCVPWCDCTCHHSDHLCPPCIRVRDRQVALLLDDPSPPTGETTDA